MDNSSSDSGLKEVWQIFYPIILMTFIGYLSNFLEKVMFGYLSAELIQASVDTYFITWIFQTCGIRFASLAQVYTGRWHGSQEYQKIGQGIWQLVWFSILSMGLTLPLGFGIGKFYFKQVASGSFAIPYLHACLAINFLYPLKMTLTGFYLGIGQISWVTRWTIGSYILKIILDFCLILGGWSGIPSLGLMGGALSTLISQGGLCILLLVRFITLDNRNRFGTQVWTFHPRLLWELIHPGLVRVLAQLLQGTGWAAISLVMARIGNSSASVLAVGASMFYFLACFGDALNISMINLNTRLLGARAFDLMKSTLANGLILIFLFSIPLAIPLVLFPQPVFHFFFPKIIFNSFEIQMIMGGIWVLCVSSSLTSMASGFVLAFKDVKFLFLVGIWTWVFEYGLCTVVGMKNLGISPLFFWVLICLGHLLFCPLFYFRMRWLRQVTLTLPDGVPG